MANCETPGSIPKPFGNMMLLSRPWKAGTPHGPAPQSRICSASCHPTRCPGSSPGIVLQRPRIRHETSRQSLLFVKPSVLPSVAVEASSNVPWSMERPMMLLHCHCPVPKDGGIVCMPASLSGQDWAVAGGGFRGARSTTKFGASQNDRLVNRSNNLDRPSSATAWVFEPMGTH